MDIAPRRILIATDQKDSYAKFAQLQCVIGSEFVQIVPRAFYIELVPKMKGNFAAYWKFDLFNALDDGEVLMYIDVDAFAIGRLKVANILELFGEGKYQLAAVPSPRPVLERIAATRIRSLFDYFNSGVLFGVRDARYAPSPQPEGCLR